MAAIPGLESFTASIPGYEMFSPGKKQKVAIFYQVHARMSNTYGDLSGDVWKAIDNVDPMAPVEVTMAKMVDYYMGKNIPMINAMMRYMSSRPWQAPIMDQSGVNGIPVWGLRQFLDQVRDARFQEDQLSWTQIYAEPGLPDEVPLFEPGDVEDKHRMIVQGSNTRPTVKSMILKNNWNTTPKGLEAYALGFMKIMNSFQQFAEVEMYTQFAQAGAETQFRNRPASSRTPEGVTEYIINQHANWGRIVKGHGTALANVESDARSVLRSHNSTLTPNIVLTTDDVVTHVAVRAANTTVESLGGSDGKSQRQDFLGVNAQGLAVLPKTHTFKVPVHSIPNYRKERNGAIVNPLVTESTFGSMYYSRDIHPDHAKEYATYQRNIVLYGVGTNDTKTLYDHLNSIGWFDPNTNDVTDIYKQCMLHTQLKKENPTVYDILNLQGVFEPMVQHIVQRMRSNKRFAKNLRALAEQHSLAHSHVGLAANGQLLRFETESIALVLSAANAVIKQVSADYGYKPDNKTNISFRANIDRFVAAGGPPDDSIGYVDTLRQALEVLKSQKTPANQNALASKFASLIVPLDDATHGKYTAFAKNYFQTGATTNVGGIAPANSFPFLEDIAKNANLSIVDDGFGSIGLLNDLVKYAKVHDFVNETQNLLPAARAYALLGLTDRTPTAIKMDLKEFEVQLSNPYGVGMHRALKKFLVGDLRSTWFKAGSWSGSGKAPAFASLSQKVHYDVSGGGGGDFDSHDEDVVESYLQAIPWAYDWFMLCAAHNVIINLDFLYLMPNKTFLVVGFIMMHANQNTARLVIERYNATTSHNIETADVHFRFDINLTVPIMDRENIVNEWTAYPLKLKNGAGTKAWNWLDRNLIANLNKVHWDGFGVFVVPEFPTMRRKEPALDITGRYHSDLSNIEHHPHYTWAHIYAHKAGWEHKEFNEFHVKNYGLGHSHRRTTICVQGTQEHWDSLQGKPVVIQGCDALGKRSTAFTPLALSGVMDFAVSNKPGLPVLA